MPGHGLISLVAYGSQDLYLTGNPQITFWKVVYKRYTNFAIESVPQPLSGNVDFGQRFSATISRNGDLVHRCLLQITLPKLSSASTNPGKVRWVDKLGHAIIDWCELVIGGTVIDRQYGEWLEIYSQLTLPPSKLEAYNRMIGHTPALLSSALSQTILYIPLQFYFCQNPGLALPLISLQYHDVRINFQLKSLRELIIQSVQSDVFQGSIVDATLYVDYIYLGHEERQQFAARRHEYLISQVQFNGAEPMPPTLPVMVNGISAIQSSITLNFSHPCKYIVWVTQKAEFVNQFNNQAFNYTDTLQDRTGTLTFDSPVELNNQIANGPLLTNTLVLNGHTRYDVRPGDYFNHVQTLFHFPNCPDSPGIYVYSFALNPTDAQPSGSNNFSRIDSAILRCEFPSTYLLDSSKTMSSAVTRIYAVSVNVLRVTAGMAGIAYCS